jgi:UDP-N-acetylmuramoyl-tripeptide--D-alanyl-D-alanine ligase
MSFLFLLLAAMWAGLTVYSFIDLLRFYQLEEYDNARFLTWAIKKWKRNHHFPQLAALLVILIASAFITAFSTNLLIAVLCSVAALSAEFIQIRRANAIKIKPLIFTARAKRLVGLGIFIILVQASLLSLFQVQAGNNLQQPFFSPGAQVSQAFLTNTISLLLLGQFVFLDILLANMLSFPIEEILRRYYIESARKVLAEVNPVVIGITGSYGKTSTKEILGHILAARYEVYKTPRSYNTLMGICKVIREELKPGQRYFIVEMGAYKPGEIAKICKLVKPQYGILTAVGPQHLERFKTIKNVAKAKNELILALPRDGAAVFNADDAICTQLSNQAGVKVRRYGMENFELCDVFARNIVLSSNGTSFEMFVKETNEWYNVKARLLGRHNVSNIMAAFLLARECGVALKEAIFAIATAAPFSHRLQLVKSENNVVYIDDSYNSNPIGARMALEVLGVYQNGRRILVTPGYAELGAIQEAEHEKLGALAGEVCDYVILVGNGARTTQIRAGALRSKIDPGHILCYNALSQVKEFFINFLKPGDMVLFENDLPDNYL